MCGIVGILGQSDVARELLDGLKRLEYRGYDSAGICTVVNGEFQRRRAEGKLKNLALPDHRQIVGAVDHLLALSRPALVSAFSKKLFSSVRSAILSRIVVSSLDSALLQLSPKTCDERSSNWVFQSVI